MKKTRRIFGVLLCCFVAFSLAGCAPQEEKTDYPGIIKPDLRVVSSYDQGGLYDGIEVALDFVTSDKRYHAGTEYDCVLRQNELRGIIKVDDFIGERGKIKFGLAVAEPSFWLDEGEKIGDIYVTMYYKKENGRIYIGKSLAEP